jgi:hypothetical protein
MRGKDSYLFGFSLSRASGGPVQACKSNHLYIDAPFQVVPSPAFAMASIFGPSTTQAVMAGQAAVGVVVNLVQLVSEVISLYTNRHEQSIQNRKTSEETSAFVLSVRQLVDT